MKLLLDENITWRLIKPLSEFFSEVKHINQISSERLTDLDIWIYAKKNGFTILTYDTDFNDLSIIKGFPPKIILLRFGNVTKQNFINKIITKTDLIINFEISSENGVLEIY